MARVTVVGAGVVGLTCAVRLLEEGHRVDVLARDLPAGDDVGGGCRDLVPLPRLPARPRARLVAAVVRRVRRAGRRRRRRRGHAPGVEVFAAAAGRAVVAIRRACAWTTCRRPAGYGDAWTFEAPVVEMPVYLALAGRAGRGAGRHDHPAQPLGPAGRAGRGRELLGHRRPAAGRGPDGRAGARPGRARLAGRPGASGCSTPRPTSPTSSRGRTTSWSAAPTRRATGAGRRPPTTPRPSWRGPAGWCPSWPTPGCCGTGSGLRPARPQVRVERVGRSCTATATVAPASRWLGTADEVVALVEGCVTSSTAWRLAGP